jgi:glycogen debranching enzyme
VAEDLLASERVLAREVLLTLAALQGTDVNLVSEEQRGRIHHEYRRDNWDGVAVGAKVKALLLTLSAQWGGNEHEMVYYGTADATALFCRLVDRYCTRYGRELLQMEVRRRDGHVCVIADCLADAAAYIYDIIMASPYGLFDFQRTNPIGLPYQVWKDSRTGIAHVDGELANQAAPIATVELQGLAYDALGAAARWLPGAERERGHYRALALELAHRTVETFAASDGTLHCAIDTSPVSGRSRLVETCTSDQGALLDSGLLGALGARKREELVSAISALMCGPRMLTAAGIRCRAIEHHDLFPWPDYHGTYAVWGKETYDIAKGLARQGLRGLARAVENRLLDASVRAGGHYEFYWTLPSGEVIYRPSVVALDAPDLFVSNFAEPGQAWTISAVLAIKRRRGMRPQPLSLSPLERHLLANVPRIEPPRAVRECPPASVRLRQAAVDTHLSSQ